MAGTPDNIYDQLIRDEDRRNRPYRDSVGKLTIGVGHNLDDKPISNRAVRVILEDDVADARGELLTALPWADKLSEPREAALINMCFNMGLGGLLTFKKMLTAVQEERWEDVRTEILTSKYAQQVGPRAHRVAQQLVEDRWV